MRLQLSDESVLRLGVNPPPHARRVEVVEHPEPEGRRNVRNGTYL
jgi:hypothetical protein